MGADVEFFEEMPRVGINGVDAYTEPVSNFLGGQPIHDQGQHFPFAGRDPEFPDKTHEI